MQCITMQSFNNVESQVFDVEIYSRYFDKGKKKHVEELSIYPFIVY